MMASTSAPAAWALGKKIISRNCCEAALCTSRFLLSNHYKISPTIIGGDMDTISARDARQDLARPE
jgi:hypothetical protein